MKPGNPRTLLLLGLILVASAAPAFAAATVKVVVETGGGDANGGPAAGNATQTGVGETMTLELIVTGGKVSQGIALPTVDGFTLNGTGTQPAGRSVQYNFFITPTRTGDFTIPAFDVKTDAGETLHVDAIKFHVVDR